MGKRHKTKKSVAKRFKKSATGKILHARAGKSHLATSKSRKRKRQLGKSRVLAPALASHITSLIG